MLQELAEIGMVMARNLRDQAAADPQVDLALTFARIARAVRQTLALHAKLDADAKADLLRAARARVASRKVQVQHLVEAAIDAETEDADGALLGRLYERLADADDCDFTDKSVPEIVAAICRDLGVPFDPDVWQDGLPLAGEAGPSPPSSPGLAARPRGQPMDIDAAGQPPLIAIMDPRDKPGDDR
jgi:hypothetical protein